MNKLWKKIKNWWEKLNDCECKCHCKGRCAAWYDCSTCDCDDVDCKKV